ncbi:MAG: hypothetical protein WA173_02075, partial [Pseudomonas sp.]|uniref:hypothetical protein n=1 Tax=Pseudomonas sp. TaxID=306 RepID=UPI003BB7F2AA
ALPAKRGRADYKAPAAGTGGGIASPLIETAGTREFHEGVLLPSTDGLAWVLWRSVKKVTMTDANEATVVMEYLNVTP